MVWIFPAGPCSLVESIIDAVYGNYSVVGHTEITLEANPDDLTNNKMFWRMIKPFLSNTRSSVERRHFRIDQ